MLKTYRIEMGKARNVSAQIYSAGAHFLIDIK
jgi:hypothetical protein